jgi:hypothetical protein
MKTLTLKEYQNIMMEDFKNINEDILDLGIK